MINDLNVGTCPHIVVNADNERVVCNPRVKPDQIAAYPFMIMQYCTSDHCQWWAEIGEVLVFSVLWGVFSVVWLIGTIFFQIDTAALDHS